MDGRARRVGAFALAFGSGFAVLTIEIAGARLIAPVFGLSVVPWTAVIGVILAALAAGSHVGGRLADAGRIPLRRLLVAAGLTAALPVLGTEVPWLARSALGFIPGAVASALVLFAPPVFFLGAVVPYLVRSETEDLASVGRRAGDVSAAATAGSIFGSFATGFVLLPAMPLPLLLGATAGALLLMALAAGPFVDVGRGAPDVGGEVGDAGPGGRAAPLLLAFALALPALGLAASGHPPDTLHAEQTPYAAVAVTERTWASGRTVRELWQNGGSSSAEYVDDGAPAHLYATTSLALLDSAGLFPGRVLVLGGAALTLPVAFERRDPGVRTDVVEIDPRVTDLAQEYFAFGSAPRPGIRIFHEAGRVHLRETWERYDLVYLDVFDHLLTVPWTMVTREALADMAGVLAPGGVFMANVLSPLEGPGADFLARFGATLAAVFADVRIYRTDATADLGATQNLLVLAAAEPGVLPALPWIEAPVVADGAPLSDAWAPVEYLQAKVFAQGLRWR